MGVSEKSLELNVGAELLARLRGPLKMRKAYLRGLTQREERKTGVDFFAQLPTNHRIFAFQFKAPIGSTEGCPYKFTLNREQHSCLHKLALLEPQAVFYVFPFYASTRKLEQHLPDLARDTWLLPVAPLAVPDVFNGQRTKRVHCYRGTTVVNPVYDMQSLPALALSRERGIPPERFHEWYLQVRRHIRGREANASRMSPHVVRGLRAMVVGGHD